MLDSTLVIGYRSSWMGADDHAFSSNHLSDEEIAKQGLTDFHDVTKLAPNMRTNLANSGGLSDVISVRGLVNSPIFGNPSVIVAVDGVALPNTVVSWDDWIDIERVEISRGPQGTRFGRNPYGGLIEVFRRQPGNELEGKLTAEVGTFARKNVKASLMGPLIEDKLWFRVGGRYSERDGYLDNTFLGNHPDDERHRTAEAALVWKPNNDWEIELAGNWLDFDDGSPRDTSLFSDPLESATSFQGHIRREVTQGSLRLRYEGESLQFTSITAASRSELDYRQDLDYFPDPINDTRVLGEVDYWSQDFRLRPLDEDSVVQWQAGLHYSRVDTDGDVIADTLGFIDRNTYTITEDFWALHGEVHWRPNDDLHVEAGLRLDYTEKQLGGRFSLEDDYFHVQPMLGMEMSLTNAVDFYGRVSYAAKPGGFSGLASDPRLAAFDEERSLTFEAGLRTRWWDDRIKLNLGAFYYDITDYQVERQITPVNYVVLNAEDTTSYGFEIDAEVELLEGLTLQGSLGYTYIRFQDFNDPISGESFDENIPPFVPEIDGYVALDYEHGNGFNARVQYTVVGDTQFRESNESLLEERAYGVLSAQFGVQREDWSLAFYAENLTDERYFTSRNFDTLSGAGGEPRHFGMRFTRSW